VLAKNGAEFVLIGYNDWPEQNEVRVFRHLIVMQAAAYQNGQSIVAAGKVGNEEDEMRRAIAASWHRPARW
jgi:hypothetical protein